MYSTKDHIVDLQRSEPGAQHLVACEGDKAPENGGLEHRSQQLHSFSKVTSSFNYNFVHIIIIVYYAIRQPNKTQNMHKLV